MALPANKYFRSGRRLKWHTYSHTRVVDSHRTAHDRGYWVALCGWSDSPTGPDFQSQDDDPPEKQRCKYCDITRYPQRAIPPPIHVSTNTVGHGRAPDEPDKIEDLTWPPEVLEQ